jgi:ATP-dependent DNA helicase RecG
VKALTGLSGTDARQLVQRLTVQALLVAQGETGNVFDLAEHLRPRFLTGTPGVPQEHQHVAAELGGEKSTDQATDQAGAGASELDRPLDRLSDVQWRLIGFADVPRSMAELMTHSGFNHRPHFVTTHLEPLLAGGVLRLTLPDKLRSPKQQYVLTDIGVKLKTMHGQAGVATEQEPEQ